LLSQDIVRIASWRIALVALAACGPGSSGASPDAAENVTSDAPRLDGNTSCAASVALGDMDRGHVGGPGGSKGPILACDNPLDERIIGIALEMSNQNTANGGRSATGIRIECARISIDPSGSAVVGAISEHDVAGNGKYNWSPATWTPVTMCKPGWVVSGMLAHEGVGGNRFLDVTITCSELKFGGGTGATETMYVTGSLTDSAMPSQAQCASGEVLDQLGSWTGAGLDAVNLLCAAATCGP
jgi:hypothetical protein